MEVSIVNFFQSIISISTTIVLYFMELLRISSLIGSYIVNYTIECVTSVHTFMKVIFQVVKILYFDFVVFVQDIAKIFSICLEFCGAVLDIVAEGVLNVLLYLRDLIILICSVPISIYLFSLYLIDSSIFAILIAAEHVKRAITLIGSGVWFILTLIPYSVFYTVCFIPTLLIDLLYFAHKGTSDIIFTVGHKFYNGLIKIGDIFTDVPCEAFAGLLIGTAVLSVIYKKRAQLVFYLNLAYHVHIIALKRLVVILMRPLKLMVRKIYVYRNYISRRNNGSSNSDISSGDAGKASPLIATGSNNLKELQKTLEIEMEERLCRVCRERRKSVIVLPCRHLCMCENCVSVVTQISRMCPLCRCPIVNTIDVYM